MRIAGMQKLTLLDFPGKTAATVFTPGCNLRCPFCHNGELVAGGAPESGDVLGNAPGASHTAPGNAPDAAPSAAPGNVPNNVSGDAALPFPELPLDEVLAFLRKRRGLLDGVCVSGGEPLLQPELAAFCETVRELGYAVKLDTNGTLPDRLAELLDAGLVNFVAMDVKNAPERYGETVGMPSFDCGAIRASIEALVRSGVPFELRTTVVRELHEADDLRSLARWLRAMTARTCGETDAEEGNQAGSAERPNGDCRKGGEAAEQDEPAETPKATSSESDAATDERENAALWFIQNFKDADTVLAGCDVLHPWDEDDLRKLLPELQAILPGARLRGIG